jgi:hypothetical protein
MKLRAAIFWVLLLHCVLFADFSSECPIFSDPNPYIDEPNTLDGGLFECGDPNLTEEYDFNAPFFWERAYNYVDVVGSPFSDPNDGYAALHSSFDPPQSTVQWAIDGPYQGDSFLLLHTGHTDPENSIVAYNEEASRIIRGSMISQKVVLDVGDTILGAYFFGTSDYLKFNDCGSIYLQPDPGNEPNDPVIIAVCDVNTVGDYESTLGQSPQTGGWITFSYTVESNQIGPYDLRCEVEDDDDSIYDSYFAIDGLRICRGGQPDADLDWDCDVDLLDFSILSRAWLVSDCDEVTDPNSVLYDPNIPCEDADIDDSRFFGNPDIWVDSNDLMIMWSEWLNNPPSE